MCTLKNQDFLYRLGHSFWTLGDHGRRSSINLRFLSSMCWGISVSSGLKYSKVFIMFAFAVSTRLYRIALAFAPLENSIITKFFRPMVKGRIACSAVYLNISITQFIRRIFLSSYLYWICLSKGIISKKMRIRIYLQMIDRINSRRWFYHETIWFKCFCSNDVFAGTQLLLITQFAIVFVENEITYLLKEIQLDLFRIYIYSARKYWQRFQ